MRKQRAVASVVVGAEALVLEVRPRESQMGLFAVGGVAPEGTDSALVHPRELARLGAARVP